MRGAKPFPPGLSRPAPLRVVVLASLVLAVSLSPGDARAQGVPGEDTRTASLADLTLEQLSSIVVTLVSRRDETLADAAASVFVITSEDIRRSGVTSLPEALRLAPNLQVAREDANRYAISARGFNSVLANKMLVMIDGRTVYSPLFSGVFWEAQDVLLEDVDRIEVVSGPGGTLWGINAVNGVIHVVTRSGADTHGGLAKGGIGTEDRIAAARYGARLGKADVRAYTQYREKENTERPDGTEVQDASDRIQAGFRADWTAASNVVTLQGDAYRGRIDQVISERELRGANVLGRWTRDLENGQKLRVQAYYDHTERDQPGAINEVLGTYDIELQHGFHPTARQNVVWGGGFRYQSDRVENLSPALAFRPASRILRVGNVFAQDDIAIREDLLLILGLKIEYNDYTEFEYLPSARVSWKPRENRLVWGAWSRAVRAPSRVDREFYVPADPPYAVLAGGPEFDSEVAYVYEIGYRDQITEAFTVSFTGFHHDYSELRSLEPSPAGPVFDNGVEGRVSGLETWAGYRTGQSWRVSAGFVYQDKELEVSPGVGAPDLGNDPNHWWIVRSSLTMLREFEFDAILRYVGSLPQPHVPSYTALDARLGWTLDRRAELSVRGRNLLDDHHAEWGAPAARPELERAVFAQVTLRI
ncbi:MAG TPA: TonB-dependent receptor [Candidatus Eisenbacteria bacterium]|nr:TonB-dependent receptor [Candidatus Eisenbacteria bacterium]